MMAFVRVEYDLVVNEGGLQEQLLRAHADDLVAPLAFVRTFSALADLRRTRAFGQGVLPDALGVVAEPLGLALFELKHPNHWKTSGAALYQVLAYAGHLLRAVGADVERFVREVSPTFVGPGISAAMIGSAVAAWRATCTEARPLGALALVCVVLASSSWEHVVSLLTCYGIDLRVITSSVLHDDLGGVRAVGWFETDPQAATVTKADAFRWARPELRFLADHPATVLASLPSLTLKRSARDFAVRLFHKEALVGVLTPMTRGFVLAEVVNATAPGGWIPRLVGRDEIGAIPEIEKLLAFAIEAAT